MTAIRSLMVSISEPPSSKCLPDKNGSFDGASGGVAKDVLGKSYFIRLPDATRSRFALLCQ